MHDLIASVLVYWTETQVVGFILHLKQVLEILPSHVGEGEHAPVTTGFYEMGVFYVPTRNARLPINEAMQALADALLQSSEELTSIRALFLMLVMFDGRVRRILCSPDYPFHTQLQTCPCDTQRFSRFISNDFRTECYRTDGCIRDPSVKDSAIEALYSHLVEFSTIAWMTGLFPQSTNVPSTMR